VCTWWCNSSIETCRQCCGGHGYSGYSGLTTLASDYAVSCTWEGDNVVMLQQTARYLLKIATKLRDGRPPRLTGFISYMAVNSPVPTIGGPSDFRHTAVQLGVLRTIAQKSVERASLRMLDELQRGTQQREAWNNSAIQLIAAAKAHSEYYLVDTFSNSVDQLLNVSTALRTALIRLRDLFALKTIEANLAAALSSGALDHSHIDWLQTEIRQLYVELRPDAVGLTDAFHLSDYVLNSVLGRFDGNVYEAFFERVKSQPGGQATVTPYFDKLIKPMTSIHCKL